MNIAHLQHICLALNLGVSVTQPTPVSGGLINKMWHVQTATGQYAIKELNQTLIQADDIVTQQNSTEDVARQLGTMGIPVASGLLHNNSSVVEVDGSYYIVYPWLSGTLCDSNQVSSTHAKIMALLVAQIHQQKLQVPAFKHTKLHAYSNDYFEQLVSNADTAQLSCAALLNENLSAICLINENFLESIPNLNKDLVVSHGDLDQKNVVWVDELHPVIIDWECAGLVNPTHEIIAIALDWSGVNAGHIDLEVFAMMVAEYQRAGGRIDSTVIEPAFDAVGGNWLNWLRSNIEQMLDRQHDDQDADDNNTEHVLHTITMLNYLQAQRTLWASIVRQSCR